MIKNGEVKEVGDKRFVLMAGKFVNINELHIDLIDTVNPFQKAFEILSKSVTKQVLKVIQDAIDDDAHRHHRGRGQAPLAEDQPFVKEHGGQAPTSAPTIRWSAAWPRRCSSCSARSVSRTSSRNDPGPRDASADARGG